ncbi:MAG: DMT family transporter [Clostridia bacterium]|nr:DMT family transporter [Clostridia bacterium]
MKKKKLLGVTLLLIAALVWGIAFVAQSAGMEKITPFVFSAVRMILGGISLLPVIISLDLFKYKHYNKDEKVTYKRKTKNSLIYGAILGVVFCIACNLQQFALVYSEPGKVAFITAIYMLFVPIICLFLRKKVPVLTWICIGLGIIGLFLLCIDINNLGGINKGDALALCCAFFYGIHIVLVERFSENTDGIKLSCMQFFVGGLITVAPALIFEQFIWENILLAIGPVLYAGFCSCGIAYTFQILGQKYIESSFATLIMSMESVFAVLASAIILGSTLSFQEAIGCVIMFIAIIIPQIFEIYKNQKAKR